MTITERILASVDERRLVKTVIETVNVSSPTGDEWAMGQLMEGVLTDAGLEVVVQEVEEGRANVLGTLAGSGQGKTLMFNGHMDTSYSGREPWLAGIPGFQPAGFEEDGHIFGLGVANMKGALCCYVEALRALRDADVKLEGDVLIAAVAGEIEKTEWGDQYRGRQYRGYSTGSRHLVTHGGVADVCILGEPTSHKIVLAHYGSLWLRISTKGPFIHTAFTVGREHENSIIRMHDVMQAVLEWIPGWQKEMSQDGLEGIVNIGALNGGMPWRASRTPHRTDLFLDVRIPPRIPMAEARRRLLSFARGLDNRFPEFGIEAEVYLTAPGAEIAADDPLVAAVASSHETVFGAAPERDVVHWFSDASALTRYGITTVNYGTASGLPNAVKGENVDIKGLMNATKVYALAAAEICGVAS